MTDGIHNERCGSETEAGAERDDDHETDSDAQPSSTQPIVKWSELWWATKAGPNVRRCKAHRRNGNQCAKAAMNGQKVCGTHGGRAAHSLAAARRRLAENADPAVRQLAKIAYDENVSVETRLKATLALIDRSVGGAKTSVDIEIGTKPIDAILETVSDQMEITSRAAYRRSQGIADDSDAQPPALAEWGVSDREPENEIVDAEVISEPYTSRVSESGHPETGRFYVPPGVVVPDVPAGHPDGSSEGGAGEPTGGMMPFTEAVIAAAEMNRAAQAGHAQIHTPRRALPPGHR